MLATYHLLMSFLTIHLASGKKWDFSSGFDKDESSINSTVLPYDVFPSGFETITIPAATFDSNRNAFDFIDESLEDVSLPERKNHRFPPRKHSHRHGSHSSTFSPRLSVVETTTVNNSGLIERSLNNTMESGADILDVREATKIVQVGEPIEMLCMAPRKIELCEFLIPGSKDVVRVVNSDQFITIPDTAIKIVYNGDGFDRGHCGLRIEKATENLNGVFKCSVYVTQDIAKKTGFMNVTVARTPTSPELRIVDNKSNEFKEGDTLRATCSVKKGRPATNFTWFLGDEILYDGLKKPVFTTTNDDLLSTEQNLTRTIQASDDGKQLKCVANHVGLNEQNKQATKYLSVNFKPKSYSKPFERFGMVEGEEGRVSIEVEANPRPVFIWSVGGEQVPEGDSYGRYQVLKTMQKESNHLWETTLIISTLTKEDVNKEYRIKATNKYGDAVYEVMISTNPEPEVISIGTGTIIIVLIVIALVFLISCVILFARAKGRWCFSVGDDHGDSLPEKGATTGLQDPSEGTENPAVNHHASTEYISNSPDLKKEKPKEDTPV